MAQPHIAGRISLWLMSIILGASVALALSMPSLAQEGDGDASAPQTGTGDPEDSQETRSPMLTAGSGGALWLFVARPEGAHALYHRPVGAEPSDAVFTALKEVKTPPIALAAGDRSAFVLYEGLIAQSVSFVAERHPSQNRYPVKQLPSLPEGSVVLGWVGAAQGPVALIRPPAGWEPKPNGNGQEKVSPQATADPTDAEADSPADPAQASAPHRLALMQMHLGRWQSISLPDALREAQVADLVMLERHTGRLAIIAQLPDAPDRYGVHEYSNSRWTSSIAKLQADESYSFVGVNGHIVGVRQSYDPAGFEAAAMLDERVVRLGRITPPEMTGDLVEWQATEFSGELLIVAYDSTGQTYWAQRNLELAPDQPTGFQTLDRTDWQLLSWDTQSVTMLIILAAFPLIMLAGLRRKPGQEIIALPKHLAPVPLGRRLGAAVLDFLAPAVLSMIVFGITDPMYFVRHWPSMHGQWVDPEPVLLAIGLYVLGTTTGELLTGRTFGKRLLGLRVVDYHGKPPRTLAVVVRNAMKLVELGAYLLLIVPAFSRYRQRIGDLVSQTIVVTELPKDEAEAKKPDDPKP